MRDRAFYCRRNSRLACNSNLSRSESVLVLHLLAATKSKSKFNQSKKPMPKFIIERELPGAGKMSADELHGISQKSCSVLNQLGPQMQWLESHVTNDKIYCIYIAPNEEMIREHAKRGGFPANRISEITSVIYPTPVQ